MFTCSWTLESTGLSSFKSNLHETQEQDLQVDFFSWFESSSRRKQITTLRLTWPKNNIAHLTHWSLVHNDLQGVRKTYIKLIRKACQALGSEQHILFSRPTNYHNEPSVDVDVYVWQTCCCKLPWGPVYIYTHCMSSCEPTLLLTEWFDAMCTPRKSFSCSTWGRRLHQADPTRSSNKWHMNIVCI